MSPNTMSEDERRELIARQHRALYGNESTLYNPDGTPTAAGAAGAGGVTGGATAGDHRRQSQDVRVGSLSGPAGPRGASPLAFDPFLAQGQSGAESAVQMPPREGVAIPKSPISASSPQSNPTTFGLIDNAQQSSRTSVSSSSGSPPLSQGGKQSTTAAGAVPIGTRPVQSAKRSTTPLPSPLSYGYSASQPNGKTERSASTVSGAGAAAAAAAAAAATASAEKPISGLGASWASNGSGWGASKNSLGVQASVWG